MFKKMMTAGVALALSAAGAFAQYPTKPIRVVVPFASGSSTDVVMRILAQPLGQAMGQTFVVDNRPGGDGAIAADPAKMAKAVVDKINAKFDAQLKCAEIRAQLDQQACAGEGSTPDWLATWTRQQLDTWGATMREAGIQPE